MESMTYNTDAYAALKTSERLQGGGRKWKAVSTPELSIWLGIVVYMGVHSSPAVRDYWRHDGLNPAHPISEHMGQTRFEEIKRYFHVSPPDRPKEILLGRRLWHSIVVHEVLDQLSESSQHYRVPSSHIAVDECMMRAIGWSPDTYKMPSKPIEQGFKFHCLADHGYIWDFHLTSNQAGPDRVPAVNGLTPTGEVVYYLSKLPLSRYWVVCLDNFYTSLPLLGRIRHDFKIGACGTARPNFVGFPVELKIPKQDVNKHKYHSLKMMMLEDPHFNQEVGA